MEFWGVEVKVGEKFKVQPKPGKLIHISQAAMGEVKDVKAAKNVHLRMKVDDKDFIIGSLAAENRPQLMFDLVFEKEFELSHDLKNGSVHFMGYIADDPADEEEFSDFGSDSADEEEPIEAKEEAKENGTVKAKSVDTKPAAGKAQKEEKVAPKVEEDSDDDEDYSDDEMAFDASDLSGDSDDEEEEDSSSEEELPVAKQQQQSKKRPAASAEKSPAAKKAKSATPDKSGKKGQNATPFPPKSAGKTPNKQKEQSPKTGRQATGKPFNKNFSGKGKGKHGGK